MSKPMGLDNITVSTKEETEVKDKTWLKDSITKEMQDLFSTTNPNYFDFEYTNKKIRGLVNQLDEPETLTPEWIEERIHYSMDQDTFGNIVRIESVPVKFLQNLLVPKQELPVIPQSVADWLKDRQKNGFPNVDIIEQIYSIDYTDNLEVHTADAPLKKYLNSSNENKEKIVKAVINDNYEVEEENAPLPQYDFEMSENDDG